MVKRRFRFTIGHAMLAIAAIAVCLGVWHWPILGFVVVAPVAILMSLVLFAELVLSALVGRRCPTCGGWRLQRFAVSSFGYRYYRCGLCQMRWKRSPMGTWEGADTFEDDLFFKQQPIADPWGG